MKLETNNFVKHDQDAAVRLGITKGTFSKMRRASDFPRNARTRRGWDIEVLTAYRDKRRARSLDPRMAAGPDDAEVQALVERRDQLRTRLLMLHAGCVKGDLVDSQKAHVIVERLISECKQSLRHSLTALGGLAHDHALFDAMEYDLFGRCLAKVFRGLKV